jgi:hypothetical protein
MSIEATLTPEWREELWLFRDEAIRHRLVSNRDAGH